MNLIENLGRGILVDEQDRHLIIQHLFHLSEGYAKTTIEGKGYYLHKLIDPENKDHKSGDKLDNRRTNLRPATQAQNAQNQKISRNNTSGYKGVFKDGKRWRAQIVVEGRTIGLGSYKVKEQAALEYDIAAKKYHGAFAKVNFNLSLI